MGIFLDGKSERSGDEVPVVPVWKVPVVPVSKNEQEQLVSVRENGRKKGHKFS